MDSRGEISSVLLTSIRLDNYGEVLRQATLPPNSFIGVCDHNGKRLYRFPQTPVTPLGAPIKPEIFTAANADAEEGLIEERGTDGVDRILTYQKLRGGPDQPPYMYIFVGSPRNAFYANAKAQLFNDFRTLFIALGLTLLSGWFLGGRTVSHRFEDMAAAAKRIGDGDLSARVRPAPDITEMDVLAHAFNSMAENLRQDTDRRTKAEEALRESESRFRKLFEQVPSVAVQGYSLDGTTIYWNAASETLYGYTPEEAVGKSLLDLIIPPEICDYVKQDMHSMAETGIPIPAGELSLMRKDGSRVSVFSSHVILQKPGGAPELFCLDIDLTDIKRAEAALLKAKEDAEAANRAKSEFLANMSHEIRTPINGVLGMLQLMETTTLDEEQRQYVGLAVTSVTRLNSLLSDILDLSRIEAGKLVIRSAEFHPADLCEALLGLFDVAAKNRNTTLECSLDPALPDRLVGDETRVRQVLFNLVGNAIKFTEHGRIEVGAHLLPQMQDGKERVLFSVTDTGIGIPADQLRDIFEPFRQVESSYTRNYQGAGLGLAIVQRLVHSMGGRLNIESEPGEGTEIHIVIPFARAEQSGADAIAETERTETKRRGLRILLVEDDPSNQFPLMKFLEKAGHEPTLAENGGQALETMTQGDFDLVLMDIQMPVMDGAQATRAIRESETLGGRRDIPIIALTAYAMAGDREKFLAMGMNGYVAKPVDMQELVRVIDEVFRASSREARD
jgi:PAS domain S-box-containing protein